MRAGPQLALGLLVLLAVAPPARAAARDPYISHFQPLLAQHQPPAEDWLLSPHVLLSSQQAVLRACQSQTQMPELLLPARGGGELPAEMFGAFKRCAQRALLHRLRLRAESADALASVLELQAVETAGLDPALYLARTQQPPLAAPLRAARLRLALEETQRLTAGRVDSSYDIPYVAGYDRRDGTRIYIDRAVPLQKVLPGSPRPVPIGQLLTLHELVEKAMLDEFQLTYPQAHQLALRIERETTRALDFSWDLYDRYLAGVIAEVGRRRPERVPPGLDLTPYESYSDAETLALRAQMHRAMRAR